MAALKCPSHSFSSFRQRSRSRPDSIGSGSSNIESTTSRRKRLSWSESTCSRTTRNCALCWSRRSNQPCTICISLSSEALGLALAAGTRTSSVLPALKQAKKLEDLRRHRNPKILFPSGEMSAMFWWWKGHDTGTKEEMEQGLRCQHLSNNNKKKQKHNIGTAHVVAISPVGNCKK